MLNRPSSVLDEEALLRLVELDPAGKNRLLARVLDAFEGSIARLMPQLEAARTCADMPGIHHVAHTLKSSSASIGATCLAGLCAEVEALARDACRGSLDERVSAPIDALIGEVRRVRAAVQQLARQLA